MSDLKFGLIGCGGLGRVHAACISRIPQARFTAYADTNLGAAEQSLADFGGDYAAVEADRLISDDSIDAVYICTRHDSHASLAIASARAGKHILIEKPLALTIEECDAVADAVREAGVVMMPAFKMRFYPLIRKAREFIPQPQVMVGQMMDAPWPDDNWAQDPVQGGANVYSQGCHTVDLLRYLSGSEAEELWAVGGTMTHPGHPCIDQCVASIRFANGGVASWVQGDAARGQWTGKYFIELFADGKSVQVYDFHKQATFHDGSETWTERSEGCPENDVFDIENEEFVSAIIEGREPCLTAHDAVQATRVVIAADRAIRTGEVQRL